MEFGNLRSKLSGVVAIPVTPFGPDGGIDEPAYRNVLRRIVDGGIGVVTPNGNTGEYYALTEAEARQAVELTVSTVGERVAVLAGVGRSVPDAVAAARHARDAGADAIMVHQPVHPYVSPAGWVDYHREIAGSVPELGVVLYVRTPRVRGEHLRELGAVAPNVVGVKYAVPDPVRFGSVARDAGFERFTWIAGLAELSAPGYWALGATGFTSGLVNVDPGASLRLLDALRAADYPAAMRLWERIRPFEELRAADESADNVAVVKEALAQLGICRPDIRPPSHRVTERARDRIAELLRAWELVAAGNGGTG